jgi:hypothetical protein
VALTQTHADKVGEAIQLSNESHLTIKELVLKSNQKGIDVNFSTLTVGDVSTPSTIQVTGDDHAGIAVNNVSKLFLTQTTVETSGSRSDAINISDLSFVQLDGVNNITTKGAQDAIGLKVGTESTVRFSGETNISTAGTNSAALLLETGAVSVGRYTGTVNTEGINAEGLVSGAANLAVVNIP